MTHETAATAHVPGRARALVGLFAGVALMGTTMVGASAVATLIASDSAGEGWSGAPNAASVLGTALGALGLGVVMSRRGRAAGLVLGYTVAAAGAGLAVWGVLAGSLALLMLGMAGIGVGNGGAQLSRYAATDLFPPHRHGLVLGAIVWAGTVGAVAGPSLISPTAKFAQGVGMPAYAGPFLLTIIAVVAAGAASALLPRQRSRPRAAGLPPARPRSLHALRLPTVKVALAAMVAAQLAMVAVMTMTPLHLHHHGHGLDTVGAVLTAHLLGMFVLAPVSGRLADRWGGVTTIVCGMGVLALAAATTVAGPDAQTTVLPAALFLLGYGWNLVFVGGSSLLSHDLPGEARTELQGVVDALVWGCSALATLGSGAVFAGLGFVPLAMLSGALVLLPLTVIAATRTARRQAQGWSRIEDQVPALRR